MIRHEDIHHIALVAPDLRRGMEEVGEVYGVNWSSIRHLDIPVRDARGDRTVPLSVVYSNQGPVFLELFEAVPDTVWAAVPDVNLHHLGVYVEDVRAEIERLEGLGMAIEAASVGPRRTRRWLGLPEEPARRPHRGARRRGTRGHGPLGARRRVARTSNRFGRKARGLPH